MVSELHLISTRHSVPYLVLPHVKLSGPNLFSDSKLWIAFQTNLKSTDNGTAFTCELREHISMAMHRRENDIFIYLWLA